MTPSLMLNFSEMNGAGSRGSVGTNIVEFLQARLQSQPSPDTEILSAPRLTCRRKLPELLVEVDPQPAEPRLKGSPPPPSSQLHRGDPKEAEA